MYDCTCKSIPVDYQLVYLDWGAVVDMSKAMALSMLFTGTSSWERFGDGREFPFCTIAA